MKAQVHQKLLLVVCILQVVICKDRKSQKSELKVWEMIMIVCGILLAGVTAFLYYNRNRQLNMREILKGYISPGQSQVTFVNIHRNSSGREVIEDAMISDVNINKSNSFDDDSYMEKDQELSIDNEEGESKRLETVFEKKEGSRSKKSKTRKRLANTAKIAQQQSERMSPSEDL